MIISSCNSNKTLSFKVSDKKLFKKYIKIWGKSSRLIGKEFDSDPVYGDSDKYIKTKIKSYGDKINTNSQSKKNTKRKYIIRAFVFDNARFCY